MKQKIVALNPEFSVNPYEKGIIKIGENKKTLRGRLRIV